MPGSIFDKTDQGTAGLSVNQPSDPFIKNVTDRLYDLDILFFTVAANVVSLAGPPAAKYR